MEFRLAHQKIVRKERASACATREERKARLRLKLLESEMVDR